MTMNLYPDEPNQERKEETFEDDSEESAFMKGFNEESEDPVCDECGRAIQEKPIIVEIEGEKHKFCSSDCKEDFEESIS
jgi:YHS domain-containing protein